MKFERGPYLTAALLCEKVLIEQDGFKSLIRIVDRVTRTAAGQNPPENMEPFNWEIFLFTRIVAGAAVRGTRDIAIQPQKPSGELMPPLHQAVHFEGEEDRGADVITRVVITLDQPGIWWFRISFEGEELTRVPLRVIYMPQVITRPIHSRGGNPPQGGDPPNEQ